MQSSLRRSTILAPIGAVLIPLIVTSYLYAIGYPLGDLAHLITGGTVRGPVYLYLLSLVCLGIGVTVGWQYELWHSIGVVLLGFLLFPWVGPFGLSPTEGGTVVSFMADAAALTIGYFLLATGQLAIRNRWGVRRWLTPQSIRLGLLVGIIHFVGLVYLRNIVWGAPWWNPSWASVGLWLWIAGGTIMLGILVTIALVRFHLVTPTVLVVGILGFAAVKTLFAPPPDQSAASISLLTLYLVGWFIPLLIAALAAALEFLVRTRYEIFPPHIEPHTK